MYLDMLLHSKNVARNPMFNKFSNIANTYELPYIDRIITFLMINELRDLDDISIYNCFFLTRFFLGKRAYFNKYHEKFSHNIYYFRFVVKLVLEKKHMFFSTIFI
jgi:hypothetical protein